MTTGLGLDSLALVELKARVEQAFAVALPDDVLGAVSGSRRSGIPARGPGRVRLPR